MGSGRADVACDAACRFDYYATTACTCCWERGELWLVSHLSLRCLQLGIDKTSNVSIVLEAQFLVQYLSMHRAVCVCVCVCVVGQSRMQAGGM